MFFLVGVHRFGRNYQYVILEVFAVIRPKVVGKSPSYSERYFVMNHYSEYYLFYMFYFIESADVTFWIL
jgi:hypothetical protein